MTENNNGNNSITMEEKNKKFNLLRHELARDVLKIELSKLTADLINELNDAINAEQPAYNAGMYKATCKIYRQRDRINTEVVHLEAINIIDQVNLIEMDDGIDKMEAIICTRKAEISRLKREVGILESILKRIFEMIDMLDSGDNCV